METMADAARQEYRNLLETDGFVRYFEQATPITVIEDLDLGSRPASRSGERTVEDLRAIPWVFSWTQSRCILPGWYAVATGIDAYLEEGGSVETLQEMYDEWPFFRTTLDNAALSLSNRTRNRRTVRRPGRRRAARAVLPACLRGVRAGERTDPDDRPTRRASHP